MKVGDTVQDVPTGLITTIAEIATDIVDGETVTFYRLADIPASPGYPDGWRHDREIRLPAPGE